MAREKVLRQSPSPSARRRERKDTRPQEIVAAAFEEFATHGYAATRLEDVASRARVSKGLPYLYFKTKEALFAERQLGAFEHAMARAADDCPYFVEPEPDRHAKRRRQLDPSDPLAIVHGLPPRLRA